MTTTTSLDLEEHIALHRIVEWCQQQLDWHTIEELRELAHTRLERVAPAMADRRRVREALEGELHRIAVKRERLCDDAWDNAVVLDWLAEQLPPIDPFGELAGGRVTTTRMLCRRTTESRRGGPEHRPGGG